MVSKDVFVYHLDNELQKLFALNRYNYGEIYSGFSLMTKVAYLICKDRILIPASNYFESDLSFKVLNDLKELNEIGAVSFISSSHNINELLDKKVFQHEKNISVPNYHYIDFLNNDNIILPGNLNKRKNSASKDIKSAWYQFISDSVIKNELYALTDNNISASQFEDILYEIPQRLGNRAYISQYIIQLLPIGKGNQNKTDNFLNVFITKSYIASFLDEYHSACLNEIPFIDSQIILPENPDGKYCYISYREIINLLNVTKYNNVCSLHFLKKCNTYELVKFKHSLEWMSIVERILYGKSGIIGKKERVEHQNMEDFSDVKIGIITALPKEFVAMKLMMQHTQEYFFKGRGAGHRFFVGDIPSANGKNHRVALGMCGMGNNQAAIRATNMLHHFKAIESLIMTGIAGGIPSFQNDNKQIRLGDIVVSEGITQYDFTKETSNGIECRSKPAKPSAKLIEAVQLLQTDELEGICTWISYIDQFSSRPYFSKPQLDTDIIYDINGKIFKPKDDCTRTSYPKIFFGNIASSNNLLKNPQSREKLKKDFNVLAVEMEASGIADAIWNQSVGYIVVRGICDYCDMHKNDLWQEYAALVAAAYTRSLIEKIPQDLDISM